MSQQHNLLAIWEESIYGRSEAHSGGRRYAARAAAAAQHHANYKSQCSSQPDGHTSIPIEVTERKCSCIITKLTVEKYNPSATRLRRSHAIGEYYPGIRFAPSGLHLFTFEEVANIQAPTMIVDREDSIPLFQMINDKFAHLLPDARRETCRGSPHGAHFATPEVFNKVVLQFLEDNRSG